VGAACPLGARRMGVLAVEGQTRARRAGSLDSSSPYSATARARNLGRRPTGWPAPGGFLGRSWIAGLRT